MPVAQVQISVSCRISFPPERAAEAGRLHGPCDFVWRLQFARWLVGQVHGSSWRLVVPLFCDYLEANHFVVIVIQFLPVFLPDPEALGGFTVGLLVCVIAVEAVVLQCRTIWELGAGNEDIVEKVGGHYRCVSLPDIILNKDTHG